MSADAAFSYWYCCCCSYCMDSTYSCCCCNYSFCCFYCCYCFWCCCHYCCFLCYWIFFLLPLILLLVSVSKVDAAFVAPYCTIVDNTAAVCCCCCFFCCCYCFFWCHCWQQLLIFVGRKWLHFFTSQQSESSFPPRKGVRRLLRSAPCATWSARQRPRRDCTRSSTRPSGPSSCRRRRWTRSGAHAAAALGGRGTGSEEGAISYEFKECLCITVFKDWFYMNYIFNVLYRALKFHSCVSS